MSGVASDREKMTANLCRRWRAASSVAIGQFPPLGPSIVRQARRLDRIVYCSWNTCFRCQSRNARCPSDTRSLFKMRDELNLAWADGVSECDSKHEPSSANEMRPASKAASTSATSKRPLQTSSRCSGFSLHAAQGLTWLARRSSVWSIPLTAHSPPQYSTSAARKISWPIRWTVSRSISVVWGKLLVLD